MSARFYEVMSSLKYSLREQDGSKFIFERLEEHNKLVIIFNTSDKYINGLIVPLRTFTDRSEIFQLYSDWKKLEENIKYLAELSKYSIIMDVEKD